MAGSPLNFPNTQFFRTRLVARNLVPYRKSPRPATPPINYEIIQSDYSVIDSPDQTIDSPTFANSLYPLNQYGSSGGYVQTRDPNRLLNTNPNEGEYGVNDATIINQASVEARNYKPLNPYGSGTNSIIDSADFFSIRDILQLNNNGTSNSQPYPTTFVSSFYSPYSILLSRNPTGTNGNMSQDSFIVRLGAKVLKREFEERIAAELYRRSFGRINVPGLNPVLNTIGFINGTVPLIQPNYIITVPANPITYATDFALRLAGSTIPFSPIPGSYFDPSINPGQPTTIQQLQNAYNSTLGQTGVGQFLANILGTPKNGSQIFINNTGSGQKKRLFFNLDFNKFKPSYDRNFIGTVINTIFGVNDTTSDYYVGSPNTEPSRVFSPPGELPKDFTGKEIQTPVYGPVEIAKLYEGETSKNIKLGANGPIYSDGGGIEGGMTWVSPKYKGNAGKKVGVGAENIKQDTDFKESSFVSTESTNLSFKEGSILDDTQRIVNSQPSGAKRLQHVGNAIDQVSKVFNDGYKEMTKGSKVLAYVGQLGQEVGAEYCRVFTKDTPFLQYNDLQKTDGITTTGRRFQYSVIDKTYNLNIYPNKREGGQDSTNLVGGDGEQGKVKKYLLSIENLAWRTSSRPGLSVSDLPVCERGPNGGRIMWFPPYDLKFNENVTASWKGTEFLGRPEPVYTYSNTQRTGTLSFKIIVDHPSILNLVVDRVLANESNKPKINSILNSFFAGCKKYDLYDLTKKFNTFNRQDFIEIQKELESQEVTTERLKYIKETLQTNVDGTNPSEKTETVPLDDLQKNYKDKAVYFENDYPKPNDNNSNYEIQYGIYLGRKNQYPASTSTFFSSVIEKNFQDVSKLTQDINKILSDDSNSGTIFLTIGSSCSAPASIDYNKKLSERRINSLKKYFEENSFTREFVESGRLKLVDGEAQGENAQPQQYDFKNGSWIQGQTYSCSDSDGDNGNSKSTEVFTINAMACRRAVITNISGNITKKITIPGIPPTTKNTEVDSQTTEKVTQTIPQEVTRESIKDNITKKIVRKLLTECNYFEVIKEETPLVYDNLKDKLKFFNPAFHSMTPEGLNSRLTFLQQCMRPGDTIPTVGSDGKLKYDDAINTAFGTPPVLVLRVGDFYHTKIIPDSLQLTYENGQGITYDMNPEGIGFQPMVANVTLGFKFIGGSGLAGAVDKLQNALSFNYYANTEIYDERADTTDLSYKVLDKEFIDFYGVSTAPPVVKDLANVQSSLNNQTIGVITSATTTQTGEYGDINYQAFMNGFITNVQNYFNNVINKLKEVNNQYNNAVRQVWTLERNYVEGALTTTSGAKIFGKPNNLEAKFNNVFNSFIDDIKNDDENLIKYLKDKNFSDKCISTLKTNYTNFLKNKKNSYISSLTNINLDIVSQQQQLIRDIGKNLVVLYSPHGTGTDGLQQANGFVKLYALSATTNVTDKKYNDTLEELTGDSLILYSDLSSFYEKISTPYAFNSNNEGYTGKLLYDEDIAEEVIFEPFSKTSTFQDDISFQRSYFILNDDVVKNEKYLVFKNQLIDSIIKNPSLFGNGNSDISNEFDNFWLNVKINDEKTPKELFTEENNITKDFLATTENEFQSYLKYNPFVGVKTKKYEFTFNSEDVDSTEEEDIKKCRETLIKSLGLTSNKYTNTDTFSNTEDCEGTSIEICKVKLN